VKYDITTIERCPLCEGDVQVGTAGPQGLEQHRGKKKCLATVKKKQQDAVMAKKPTLFSYLHRQETALPTAADLVREAERNEVEDATRIVVSQAMKTKAVPRTMYTAQHTDQDAQGQSEDTDPSADRDLDSDLDQDLDQGWDQDEPLTWSSVKIRGYESGCGPPMRSAMPNDERDDVEVLDRTLDEAKHRRRLAQGHGQNHQATHARKGCHEAWLLLDHLHAEISIVHEALEDNEGNELSLAGYNRSAAIFVCTDIPHDKVWENVNPGLDRILGFGRPKGEIAAMVRGSREGLQGLYVTVRRTARLGLSNSTVTKVVLLYPDQLGPQLVSDFG
jgi:hypothetical protein